MQISDNAYLDIKVKSAKALQSSIALSYDNLKNFIIVETAGASLPYACFSFFTSNKELVEYFIENNKIEVTVGNTVNDAETFIINLINTPKDTDSSGDMATITASGFLGDTDFMVNKGHCEAYRGNSLMVARQVLMGYKEINGIIDSDFDTVKENQVTWRQLFETSASFLARVLLHMDLFPSFPLFTFDKYGKFHIKDYQKAIKEGAKFTFTPYTPDKGEIKYINNFNVDSYKSSYNLYSGYNKITEIFGSEKGMASYALADNIPILASTKEAEKSMSGNRVSLNKIQTVNVHNTYMEAFAYNTNRLISLSSMQGVLQIPGYHPELKPTDLVYVKTPTENGMISSIEGLYLIDTIVISPSFREGIVTTYVYVTRDNNNNIENFVTQKPQGIHVSQVDMNNLMNAVSLARVALTMCSQIIDGTFIRSVTSYLSSLKTNLLKAFSIEGTLSDLNSQLQGLQNSLCVGNTIMNALVNMVLPASIASTLQDFLINKPSMKSLLLDYISQYVPLELQSSIYALVDSFYAVYDSLNSIAEDNRVTAREIVPVTIDNTSYNEEETKVDNIIQSFENNTTGLDIPFPIISLTEAQELLPDKELKDFVANETIDNLTDLGYMSNLSDEEVSEFKDILLGNTPISYNIINKINEAAGDTLNYRFWGTYGATNEPLYAWSYGDSKVFTKVESITQYARLYNENYTPYMDKKFVIAKNSNKEYKVMYEVSTDTYKEAERDEESDITTDALSQLTNFYITKGFKDKYRTLPCTKIINAQKNARLYFACPQTERNVKFYINSRRVELKSFPMLLGYTDVYGNPITYNVYYTNTGYNSNSTVMEVRQG